MGNLSAILFVFIRYGEKLQGQTEVLPNSLIYETIFCLLAKNNLPVTACTNNIIK